MLTKLTEAVKGSGGPWCREAGEFLKERILGLRPGGQVQHGQVETGREKGMYQNLKGEFPGVPVGRAFPEP
jgi:hypothetical protein